MIPLPGLVNAEVSVRELQDVRVESPSFMRITYVEDCYVHSGGGDQKLATFGIVF